MSWVRAVRCQLVVDSLQADAGVSIIGLVPH
jgi:hypothetical protein